MEPGKADPLTKKLLVTDVANSAQSLLYEVSSIPVHRRHPRRSSYSICSCSCPLCVESAGRMNHKHNEEDEIHEKALGEIAEAVDMFARWRRRSTRGQFMLNSVALIAIVLTFILNVLSLIRVHTLRKEYVPFLLDSPVLGGHNIINDTTVTLVNTSLTYNDIQGEVFSVSAIYIISTALTLICSTFLLIHSFFLSRALQSIRTDGPQKLFFESTTVPDGINPFVKGNIVAKTDVRLVAALTQAGMILVTKLKDAELEIVGLQNEIIATREEKEKYDKTANEVLKKMITQATVPQVSQ